MKVIFINPEREVISAKLGPIDRASKSYRVFVEAFDAYDLALHNVTVRSQRVRHAAERPLFVKNFESVSAATLRLNERTLKAINDIRLAIDVIATLPGDQHDRHAEAARAFTLCAKELRHALKASDKAVRDLP